MKIGIDARPLSKSNLTGIGNYVTNIISYIQHRDKYNEYFLYSNKPFARNYEFNSNIKIRIIPGKQGTLWLRYCIPSKLKDDCIDIFWGTQHILPPKICGIKYILTIHDLALLINPLWGKWYNALILNLFVKKSVMDADKIIAISESTKKDLISICKIEERKIDIVSLGGLNYNLSHEFNTKISCILKKYDINSRYFLYVGTLEPRKNIITIVKAFEKICRVGYDCNLVLAGGIGWNINSTIKYINNSAYKDRIIFTGYISEEEKIVLYRNAVAFVFPSNYEGFGIPVLEAMQNQCIVITDKVSSLPEVGGDAAIYVENHKDHEALADVMQQVIEFDDEARNKYIKLGLEQVGKFSWEKCGEETMKCILGVMG